MIGVDLFCGIGGSSAGAQAEGVDVRLAVDLDPDAVAWYRANHLGVPVMHADVASREVLSRVVAAAPDLLMASHPRTAGRATARPTTPHGEHGGQDRKRWSMVVIDSARPCLRLPDSKTGARVVPLSPQAAATLAAAQPRGADPTALVCATASGRRIGNIERTWQTLRSRAGLEDVRLHDLRHSAASDAIAAGVPLALVGGILGHRSTRTTARYAHLADDALAAAAAAMGAAIETRTARARR